MESAWNRKLDILGSEICDQDPGAFAGAIGNSRDAGAIDNNLAALGA